MPGCFPHSVWEAIGTAKVLAALERRGKVRAPELELQQPPLPASAFTASFLATKYCPREAHQTKRDLYASGFFSDSRMV